jgi:hypothetical protein
VSVVLVMQCFNNASDPRLLMEVFGEADSLVMYRFLEQS